MDGFCVRHGAGAKLNRAKLLISTGFRLHFKKENIMQDYNYEPVEHEPYDVEAAQAAEDREAEKYDIDKDWEY